MKKIAVSSFTAVLAFLLAASADAAPHGSKPVTAAGIEGVVRVSGPTEMTPLLQRWEAGFRRAQPMADFSDQLHGRDAAIYGIEMRTADVALLDRPINPFERYGTYEHSWIFPVAIEIATDGVRSTAEPATEAVFVRADNPLAKLTIAQLDGIFGGQRDGGFDKLDWVPGAGRTSASNIRTWGQLGVTGTLAAAPIHPYGPASHGNGVITFFQERVLKGGAMRAEDLREYPEPSAMFAAMADDPQAIGYGPIAAMPAGFKAIALSVAPNGPFVKPMVQTLKDRRYPLAKPIYLYFTIDTTSGQLADPRVDAKVMAFVTYILSPAGQDAVRQDGRYLPLTADEAKRQLAILDSHARPAERPL